MKSKRGGRCDTHFVARQIQHESACGHTHTLNTDWNARLANTIIKFHMIRNAATAIIIDNDNTRMHGTTRGTNYKSEGHREGCETRSDCVSCHWLFTSVRRSGVRATRFGLYLIANNLHQNGNLEA